MIELIKTLDKKQIAAFLVLLSYTLQGAASLIYQVSAEQAMEKIVGVALPTMAIIISSFFVGMALGAYSFAKRSLNERWISDLLIGSQFLLAFFGIFFVRSNGLDFISLIQTGSEDWLGFIFLIRLIVAGLLLFAPSFVIGASFPLLMAFPFNIEKKAQKLYFANSLGSVFGALLSGFILLPKFGLSTSILFAVLLNLVSGCVFVLVKLIKKKNEQVFVQQKIEQKLAKAQAISKHFGSMGLVISIAAFFNMLLELLFMRLFVLFMGSSGFAFALVSAIQLFALTAASFFAAYIYKQKDNNIWKVFSVLYIFGSIWLLISLTFLPYLPVFAAAEQKFLSETFHFSIFQSYCLSHISNLLLVIFFPCFCLGAVLPVYFLLRQSYPHLVSLKSSYAFALNLFASVVGCLLGGVIIFPVLSRISSHAIYFAFALSALIVLLTGLFIFVLQNGQKKIVYSAASVIIVIILGFGLKPVISQPLLKEKTGIAFYKEGVNATVSLVANEQNNIIRLETDGQTEATLPLDERYPALLSDEHTQVLLGLLPSILSLEKMSNVFLIGFGTGVTAQTILSQPGIQKLTVAELEPDVILASKYLKRYAYDKRLDVKFADGRSLLSMFNSNYDSIICQSGEPWRSSSKNLYTLEFWQQVKERLKSNSIFCQWIPLYAMDRDCLLSLSKTFSQVFPNTFVIRPANAGEIIFLAFNIDLNGKIEEDILCARLMNNIIDRAKISAVRKDLVRLGFADIKSVLTMFKLGPSTFTDWINNHKDDRKIYINSDDFPFVQYKLQNLVMKEGIKFRSDLDKMVANDSVPTQFWQEELGSKNYRFSNIDIDLKEAKNLIEKKDFLAALSYLEKIVKQDPNNFDTRFLLGRILCNLNREDEGLVQIKWASRMKPQDPAPNLYITLFYALRNNWPMANDNLKLLEKKWTGDSDLIYLEDQIYAQRKLDLNNPHMKNLMLKGHYPI